ncbi:FRG domain-containing protein [Acinetobacter radioresistens]|uniref:FRG domain-containing protein n=1 Tax=Acinetobacter radioresistens TaxID=40216 RepID=UPI002003E2A4|nr:FRG domain-containing protein [Acinetobacter radioresistens]MCK4087515.1 FRG domain-containing protein [Acinetobacter radioresistens]
MIKNLISKFVPKDGYYEIYVDDAELLLNILRPENKLIPKLMTEWRTNFRYEPSESEYDLDEVIYRGMADSNWELEPSFQRLLCGPYQRYLFVPVEENRILKNFQDACDISAVQLPNDSIASRKAQNESISHKLFNSSRQDWLEDSYIELAAFAQHYGVPTRLLDWTKHPLVASYFAVSNIFSMGYHKTLNKYFSIWVFNTSYIHELHPAAKIIKIPTSINSHAANQQGCFTVVEQDKTLFKSKASYAKLNDCFADDNTSWRLLKININNSLASKLFDFCNAYNFNASFLFRGPHGAAKHAMDLWNNHMFNLDGINLDDEI